MRKSIDCDVRLDSLKLTYNVKGFCELAKCRECEIDFKIVQTYIQTLFHSVQSIFDNSFPRSVQEDIVHKRKHLHEYLDDFDLPLQRFLSNLVDQNLSNG